MKPTFEQFARMVDERARRKGPHAEARLEAVREHVRLVTALAVRRKEIGLSQSRLARRAGLHQCDISDFEAGKLNPGTRTLLAIVSALDAEVQVVPRTGAKAGRRGVGVTGTRALKSETSARAGRTKRE